MNEKEALTEILKEMEQAECDYRQSYARNGGGDIRTGRAWDRMRRAGDAIRKYLDETSAVLEKEALQRECGEVEKLKAKIKRLTSERDAYKKAADEWMRDYDKMVEKYEPKELIESQAAPKETLPSGSDVSDLWNLIKAILEICGKVEDEHIHGSSDRYKPFVSDIFMYADRALTILDQTKVFNNTTGSAQQQSTESQGKIDEGLFQGFAGAVEDIIKLGHIVHIDPDAEKEALKAQVAELEKALDHQGRAFKCAVESNLKLIDRVKQLECVLKAEEALK